jgi:hypothetical protein
VRAPDGGGLGALCACATRLPPRDACSARAIIELENFCDRFRIFF